MVSTSILLRDNFSYPYYLLDTNININIYINDRVYFNISIDIGIGAR